MQRASVDSREAWHRMCDLHRGGMRDPKQLDPAFLDGFLRSVAELPNGPNSVDQTHGQQSALVERVERLLKASRKVQRAWDRACDLECGGTRDPNHLEVAFLQRFLVKHDTCAEDGSGPIQQPVRLKRTRVAIDARELATAEQVEAVKRAQKASAHWREVWQEYCDSDGQGMRDPAQLSASFVRRFLQRVESEKEGLAPNAITSLALDRDSTTLGGGDHQQGLSDALARALNCEEGDDSASPPGLTQRARKAPQSWEEEPQSWEPAPPPPIPAASSSCCGWTTGTASPSWGATPVPPPWLPPPPPPPWMRGCCIPPSSCWWGSMGASANTPLSLPAAWSTTAAAMAGPWGSGEAWGYPQPWGGSFTRSSGGNLPAAWSARKRAATPSPSLSPSPSSSPPTKRRRRRSPMAAAAAAPA